MSDNDGKRQIMDPKLAAEAPRGGEVGAESGDQGPRTAGEAAVLFSPRLTGSGRRYLRGLGHHLKPVVLVGDKGVHEGIVRQVDQCLLTHELIKVKIHGSEVKDRINAAQVLFTGTGGQVVQILGGTLLVYRARPEEPTIVIPRGGLVSA